MAAHAGLNRRAESNNNTIILVVAIVVGVVVLLGGIVLAFIIVRRRRRNPHQGSTPPMASYNHKSNMSTSSSLLPDMSSDWHQPSLYPRPSHNRTEFDTSTQSSLQPEPNSGWYRPSHYVQASHNRNTSDTYTRPPLPEMKSEWGYSSHYLSHSRVTSESSTKPLLPEMNNDLDRVERPIPIHRTTEEDILFNNPTGQYRVPISRPCSRDSHFTHASSSFCLAGMDAPPPSDNPYLSHRPTLPVLPPLVIPQKSTDRFTPPQIPSTVVEEQSAASCESSASSAYSQTTARSPPHSIYLPVRPNRIVEPEPEPREEGRDAAFVGTLLRARAERNPGGLVRETSQVSHIERTGSIKSVSGSDQPYPQRYRAKKSGRVEDLDTLREVSDRGSVQSPS